MKSPKILLLAFISLGLCLCAPSQKKVAKDNEKDPQYQYGKGVIAMKYGLVDEALKYVNQALSLDPGHSKSNYLLGVIQLQKRNFAEAASAFEKSLQTNPDYTEAHSYLGTAYLEMGIKDKAESEYQKAFALDGNAYAGFNLAKLCLEKNRLETALEYIEKSLQKSGREAPAHNLKGVILNQLTRYPEAIASFQTALSISPADVNLSINLGIACLNDKQFEKARGIFEEALPLIQDQTLKDKVNEYLKIIKNR